jgi:murein DD-endopeptidase MepM/ murein hydrolase activator NlpD
MTAIYKEPFSPKLRGDEFGNLAPYREGRPHRGQDWSPKELSPIPSICAGKVHNVFWTDGLGWVVEVWEPIKKVFIQYAHVAPDTVTVKKNQKIELGHIIGKTGGGKNTPSGRFSTGSHLHLSISTKVNGHLADYKFLINPLKHILENKGE